MSKTNNLKDFLKDLADAIRIKTYSTEKINPQDFSTKIKNLTTTNTPTIIIQNYRTKFGNDIY